MCRHISGNNSLPQRPVWPCGAKFQSGFITRWEDSSRLPELAILRASLKLRSWPSFSVRMGL